MVSINHRGQHRNRHEAITELESKLRLRTQQAEKQAALNGLAETSREIEQEPVACIVGMKGSAFDLPTTKRAYTYANQPNNGVAHRLGMASCSANFERAGDSIDRGLILLKYLQAAGYGVFDLGAEYAASNKTDVTLADEGNKAEQAAPSKFFLNVGLSESDKEKIKQSAAELVNQELVEALKKANAQTEHFERLWYLRGDLIEQLVEALEHHQAQTRPIQKTIDALAKAR